ncbi:MAG: TetR/AcrR family transcriptional regulator [Gammaproteobacteria bacterium]|nr:TetR/AcrR family transcriptional regulator [Gammaproteobacteria bacterium]
MPYLKKIVPVPEPIDCKVLTAALDLFVTRGFHNVSIHDVQKTANVSIGSIYNHFGGKEGIAKALYLHLLNEMNEMIDSVLEEKTSPVDRCNRVIQLLLEYSETKTNIISYVLYSKHSEYIQDGAPICSAEPFRRLREIVQYGMDQGSIKRMDLMVASSIIFGGAIKMIQYRLDGLIDKPLPELYDELIAATWHGILLPAEASIEQLVAMKPVAEMKTA